MKNVKPKAGQVWECISDSKIFVEYGEKVIVIESSKGAAEYQAGNKIIASSFEHFNGSFKFIPQNDLEWLAVNVEKWNGDKHPEVIDNLLIRIGDKDWSFTSDGYTRDQWQNKRIELGLDEPKQKKTKMIDLRAAEIGDKFNCNHNFTNDVVMEVLFSSESLATVILGANGFGDMQVDFDGMGITSKRQGVISKHEPRHWLKDLPDADLFTYQWLACDEDGSWYYYSSEPKITTVNHHANYYDATEQSGHLDCLKMPTLTGDEWQLSKISIDELRAWQTVNK